RDRQPSSDWAELRQGTLPRRELLEPRRRPEEDQPPGQRPRGRTGPSALLDAGARQGPCVRVDPRPLRLDLRRPAVPYPAAARHRVDREGTGRSVQRPRPAGSTGEGVTTFPQANAKE